MNNPSTPVDLAEAPEICTRTLRFPPPEHDLSVMEVGRVMAPEGVIYPETRTTFCTVVWCVCGELIFELGGESLRAKSGESLVLDRDTQVITQAGASGCDVYYLLMDGPQSNQLLETSGIWTGVFPFASLPIQWLNWTAANINQPQFYASVASSGQSLYTAVQAEARATVHDPLVWDAICYLQQHWNHPATNGERVLRHLNVSRSKLSPRFKAETGVTLKDYLYAIRYRHAIQMLEQAPISIADIAKQCGIPDPAHFTYWFRKQSGKSPSAFKRKATAR